MAEIELQIKNEATQTTPKTTLQSSDVNSADLPTGVYPLMGAQAEEVGLPNVSGMLLHLRGSANFQHQRFFEWMTPYRTFARRNYLGTTEWTGWVEV